MKIRLSHLTAVAAMMAAVPAMGFAQSAMSGSMSSMSSDPMVGGAAMYPSKNIVQTAVNSKDHTTLVAAVTAAVTSALLVCDAWINIIPAHGAAFWEAIAMAFVELPLAALSFWVATRHPARPGR